MQIYVGKHCKSYSIAPYFSNPRHSIDVSFLFFLPLFSCQVPNVWNKHSKSSPVFPLLFPSITIICALIKFSFLSLFAGYHFLSISNDHQGSRCTCTVCLTSPGVFTESNCLVCSVPVFLHSHLLLCLPILDSRQVHFAGWQWAFLQPSPCIPAFPPQPSLRHTHSHTQVPLCPYTSLLAALPSLFVPLSVSGKWIICTASLPSCASGWILLLLGVNGFLRTHCSLLRACVLLVWLLKCHAVQQQQQKKKLA